MFDVSAVCQAPAPSLLDTTKTIVTALSIPVALLTFWLGYRQKDRERMLTYYHKAVVDVSLQKIFDFFKEQRTLIDQAGRDAILGVDSADKSVPTACKATLAGFSTGLFNLKDSITERTALFDDRITPKIEEEFEDIQDKTSEWFDEIGQFKRREVPELAAVLIKGQRDIIRELYRGQFRDLRRWNSFRAKFKAKS